MGVVLIGYRGSGKTTVGRILAAKMNASFIDTDELIVRRAGKTIREIFQREGETAFRDLETQVLREQLPELSGVMSLGGGALLRETNRAMLRAQQHQVVYLRCEAGELNRRIQEDERTAAMRPALSHLGGGIAEIESLLSQREIIYRAARSFEIDVTRLTCEQAAGFILKIMATLEDET